jgi:hypothetical protein
MKMLFFSSDNTEVELVSAGLVSAGIPCEIRPSPAARGTLAGPPCGEVWIQNDNDCHRALMLCVERGVGFARRPPRPIYDEEECEPEEAVA